MGKSDKNEEKSEMILLPAMGESAAITLKVKTAALYYDRIWATSNKVVPEPIRFWSGSPAELNGRGLAADWNIQTKRAPIAAMCGPEEKKFQLLRASTDLGLGLILREIAKSISTQHGVTVIPVYDLVDDRDKGYQEGERQVIVATLFNLGVVDEGQLTWEQVIEFRQDEQVHSKYKRFLHWLDKEMVGKSQRFIEDEISQRLEDYEWALKKHGIKTVVGEISEVLAGGGLVAILSDPKLGFLTGGLLLAGKVAVKIAKTLLDYDDIERGANSEISWVYEVKKLGK